MTLHTVCAWVIMLRSVSLISVPWRISKTSLTSHPLTLGAENVVFVMIIGLAKQWTSRPQLLDATGGEWELREGETSGRLRK